MKNNIKQIHIFCLISVFFLPWIFYYPLYAQEQKNQANTGAAAKPWFTAKPVADKVWCIDDHGSDNIYLVTGKEKALLIDTGTGVADLKAFVKTLTKLPITVVDTHGHPDHAGGNYQFQQIFAQPLDFAMIQQFNSTEYHQGAIRRVLQQFPDFESAIVKDIGDFQISTVTPLYDGYVFDLGGRKLEVIRTPGHTQGSICLVDAKNKLLFAGDNDNELVWLFLKDCLPLEVYLQSLQKLQQRNTEFELILPGHGQPLDRTFIDEQIMCAKSILQGDCTGEPYKSFAGDALKCSYKRASIAFNPDNLRIKK
jgi:hydroxyacylglutathione hydrolase